LVDNNVLLSQTTGNCSGSKSAIVISKFHKIQTTLWALPIRRFKEF